METILIAHRGNVVGPHPEMENHPEYIETALQMGFDVEVDVWYSNGGLHLGHDGPEHRIEYTYLQDRRIWVHTKNIEAFQICLQHRGINCFYLDVGGITLTSQGFIWTYGTEPISGTIYGGDSTCQKMIDIVYGICSDYVQIIQQSNVGEYTLQSRLGTNYLRSK